MQRKNVHLKVRECVLPKKLIPSNGTFAAFYSGLVVLYAILKMLKRFHKNILNSSQLKYATNVISSMNFKRTNLH